MTLNKNEKGLTLIELLITIAVIAIVAAISIPVITNVIDSSRTSSAESMQAQVDAFVDRYDEAGQLNYDPATQTFTGSVDLNADGSFSTDEVIETFTVDAGQFAVTVNTDDTYTVAGGAGATDGAALDGPTIVTIPSSAGAYMDMGNLWWGSDTDVTNSLSAAFSGVVAGNPVTFTSCDGSQSYTQDFIVADWNSPMIGLYFDYTIFSIPNVCTVTISEYVAPPAPPASISGVTLTVADGEITSSSLLSDSGGMWLYFEYEILTYSNTSEGMSVTVVTDLGTYNGTITMLMTVQSSDATIYLSLDGAPAFGSAQIQSVTFN